MLGTGFTSPCWVGDLPREQDGGAIPLPALCLAALDGSAEQEAGIAYYVVIVFSSCLAVVRARAPCSELVASGLAVVPTVARRKATARATSQQAAAKGGNSYNPTL